MKSKRARRQVGDDLPLLSESPETVRRPISEEASRLDSVVHKISNTSGPNPSIATEASSKFEDSIQGGELPKSHGDARRFMRKYAKRLVMLVPVSIMNGDNVAAIAGYISWGVCWINPYCPIGPYIGGDIVAKLVGVG